MNPTCPGCGEELTQEMLGTTEYELHAAHLREYAEILGREVVATQEAEERYPIPRTPEASDALWAAFDAAKGKRDDEMAAFQARAQGGK